MRGCRLADWRLAGMARGTADNSILGHAIVGRVVEEHQARWGRLEEWGTLDGAGRVGSRGGVGWVGWVGGALPCVGVGRARGLAGAAAGLS